MNDKSATSSFEINLEPITGNFVLCCEDCSEELTSGVTVLYLETDLGVGKASHWTDVIDEATIFTTVDEAVTVLCRVTREYSPVTVRELLLQH